VGWINGGTVTNAGGLSVTVTAGDGFIISSVDSQIYEIPWNGTGITLVDGTSNYIYIVPVFSSTGAYGVLTSSTAQPVLDQVVYLGRAFANSGSIEYITSSIINMNQHGDLVESFERNALGPIYVIGSTVTEDVTPFSLDVTSGQYYYGTVLYSPSGASPITMNIRYRNGSGGWVYNTGTGVDNSYYDNGSGTLFPLSTGYYAKPSLYTVGEGVNESYILFYSQAEYTALAEAEVASIPTTSPDIINSVALIATPIVQQGATGITEILDERPRVGFKTSGVTASADHTQLLNLNLGNAGHQQFLMLNGSTPMASTLNMSSNSITNISTANGVVIEAHESRHLPNGADPLVTAAPTTNLSPYTPNAVGVQNSFSRSDHSHTIVGFQVIGTQVTGTSGYFSSQLTGTSAFFTSITGSNVYAGMLSALQLSGQSAFFTSITGAIMSGTSAFFTSITGTSLIAGSSHTGDSAFFTTITGTSTFSVAITGYSVYASQLTGQSAFFTVITGTSLISSSSFTGQSAFFTSITGYNVSSLQLTGQSAFFTAITGAIITGTSSFFTSITGYNVSALQLTGQSSFFTSITGYNVYAGTLSALQLTGQSAFFSTITGNSIYSGALVITGAGLSIYGQAGSTAGPQINTYTTQDGYPALEFLTWYHDNQDIYFDRYYDGANERASSTSASYSLTKSGGVLKLTYAPATTAGSLTTTNTAITINSSGQVSINSISGPSAFFATVTGYNAYTPQISGQSAFFNSITGTQSVFFTTVTGYNAYTPQISGQSAFFNSITGTQSVFFTTVTGYNTYAPQISGQSAYFTSITGTQSVFFTTVTGYNIYAPQISGQSAYFTSITGTSLIAGSSHTGQSAFFNSITGTNISASSQVTANNLIGSVQAMRRFEATSTLASYAFSNWTTISFPSGYYYSACWASEIGIFCTMISSSSTVLTSPDGITWTSYTLPVSATWGGQCICWSPQLRIFCAVSSGYAVTSSNGSSWSSYSLSGIDSTFGICWSADLGLFCAMGSSLGTYSYAVLSSNGSSWTNYSMTFSGWDAICWASELGFFVAISNNGYYATSANGQSWTSAALPISYGYSVCYSPELSLFIVPGTPGSTGAISTNGTTWTTITLDSGVTPIIWIPELGIFVSTNTSGGGLYSTNGTSWTTFSTGLTNSYAICWAPELGIAEIFPYNGTGMAISRYVKNTAYGNGGNRYFSTISGTTAYLSNLNISNSPLNKWTLFSYTTGVYANACAWSEQLGMFLATDNLNSEYNISYNGTSWTSQSYNGTTYNPSAFNTVTYVPELGLWCVATESSVFLISSTGLTSSWTTSTITANTLAVAWSPALKLLCIVGSTNPYVSTSPNGTTWTTQTVAVAQTWQTICWSDTLGLFCALSSATTKSVMTSSNGTTWTSQTPANANGNWSGICWSSDLGLFVAVSSTASVTSNIMYSSNGTSWTAATNPTATALNGVCWARGFNSFIAVGTNYIITSSNGINWTTQTSPGSIGWNSPVYAPSLGLVISTYGGSQTSMYSNTIANITTSSLRLTTPLLTTSTLAVTNTQNSYDYYSGSITTDGGVGIAKNLNIGGTTASTSTTTGALVVAGGIGVAGNINATNYIGGVQRMRKFQTTNPIAAVAVGAPGTVTASTAWGQVLMTSLTSSVWVSWFGCWSSELGMLVAISQTTLSNGNSYIAYTQTGMSWTTLVAPKNDTYSQVSWSPELKLFAIIGIQYILTSSNGTTWTTIANPVYTGGATTGLTWNTLVWSPDLGIFCTVANGSYSSNCYSMTCSDGVTWTSSNSAFPYSVSNPGCSGIMCWSSELGIFVAPSSTIGVCYSSNGTTWTTTNSSSNGMQAVSWAPELGLFIGGNLGNGYSWYSSDGINWNTTSNFNNSHNGVSVWSPELGVFVMQNSGGSGISANSASYDGINWFTISNPNVHSSYAGTSCVVWCPELGFFIGLPNNYSYGGGAYFYSSYSTYVKNTGPYGNGGNKYFGTIFCGTGPASSSVTTGTLVVAGGAGVAGAIYCGGLNVNGVNITKSFVIDHPKEEDKYLIHACIEGPTSDVFYRGKSQLKNGTVDINLPEYFENLTEEENRTISLTTIRGYDKLTVWKEIEKGNFTVCSDNEKSKQEFYWEVKAIRKGGIFKVDPYKDEIRVHGDGPYKYYEYV
jgi:hypothetical protein